MNGPSVDPVMDERRPVWSPDAERALIGGFLLNWDSKHNRAARAKCHPHMLYQPALRLIYETMLTLEAEGYTPDAVCVASRLQSAGRIEEVGGRDHLAQLMEEAVSSSNAAAYAKIVREDHVRRQVLDRCEGLASLVREGAEIRRVYDRALNLPRGLAAETTEVYRMSDIDVETPEAGEYVPTGYRTLDEAVRGYPRSELTMVMAPTGRGKSCWLLWAAHLAAMEGLNTVFATYEMPAKIIKRRLLKHICGWTHRPTYDLGAAAAFDAALKVVDDEFYPLEVYDPSSRLDSRFTVEELRDYLLAKAEVERVDLVLVDYYQRISSGKRFNAAHEELAWVSRSLTAVAKRTGCAIVAGSQIAEEQHGSGYRSRIRGSREGENDAALILEINRDQTGVTIQKARHGRSGITMHVRFDPERLVFFES